MLNLLRNLTKVVNKNILVLNNLNKNVEVIKIIVNEIN